MKYLCFLTTVLSAAVIASESPGRRLLASVLSHTEQRLDSAQKREACSTCLECANCCMSVLKSACCARAPMFCKGVFAKPAPDQNVGAPACQVTQWTQWGSCTIYSSGNGHQQRSRHKNCGEQWQNRPCNEMMQAINSADNCVKEPWSPWGSCSKTCGVGVKQRSRLNQCKKREEWDTDRCQMKRCYRTSEWSPWSPRCYFGSCAQTRVRKQHRVAVRREWPIRKQNKNSD